MPTSGIVSGTKLRLFDDATAIARATDCSVEFSAETESVSHKDSTGGWAETEVGELSGTGSCEILFEETTGGFSTLWDKFINKTALTLKMTTGVTGDTVISGQAYVTSMTLTGTHKQKATASISFTFSGAVSRTVVA